MIGVTHKTFIRIATGPALAAMLCLNLAACQTPPSGPGAELAADNSDPCQGQRSAFASSKTYFKDQIVSAAVTGAAVGAGVGALTGLAATGNLRGALIGAAAGGLAGGIIGGGNAYYNTLSQHARDQNELANDMNQDLSRESTEIDHTAVAFAHLRQCRFREAWAIKTAVRHGELDRQTGLARIAYHQSKFAEELRVAHEFGLTMAKRSQQFQEAANDLRTKPPQNSQGQAVAAAPRTKVAQVDHAAAVSVPEKRASYDNTVANAETNSKAAFNLDSNTNLSWLLFNGLDG
jgi:outer membrane lipoprotein SlyB